MAPNLIFPFTLNAAEDIECFLGRSGGAEVPSNPLTSVFNVLEGDDGELGELDFEEAGELRYGDEKDGLRFDERKPPLLELRASLGERFAFESTFSSSCTLEIERRNRAFIECDAVLNGEGLAGAAEVDEDDCSLEAAAARGGVESGVAAVLMINGFRFDGAHSGAFVLDVTGPCWEFDNAGGEESLVGVTGSTGSLAVSSLSSKVGFERSAGRGSCELVCGTTGTNELGHGTVLRA